MWSQELTGSSVSKMCAPLCYITKPSLFLFFKGWLIFNYTDKLKFLLMSSASPPNTTSRIMLLYFYRSPHPLHIMILESLGDRELEPEEKNFLLPSGRNFRMTESVEKFRIMVPCQWGIAYFFLYCEENLIYREHTREPKYHTSHFLLILSFLR